jgi:hypothetical protein
MARSKSGWMEMEMDGVARQARGTLGAQSKGLATAWQGVFRNGTGLVIRSRE